MLALLGLAALVVRLPLLVLEPGPAPDLAGRATIDAPTYESAGSMHLTTAQIRYPNGSTIAELLAAALDEDKTVLARAAIYPANQSSEHTESIQLAQMARSEFEAAVAALGALGEPFEPAGAFVTSISESVPAAQHLRAGDIITGINSRSISLLEDLNRELGRVGAGQDVRLDVARRNEHLSFTVQTVRSPAGRSRAALGTELAQYHRPPIEVTIASGDIGGPSAGLMYALSIYDHLVPEDLTGGRKIAGTGTIDNGGSSRGRVGPVGSVGLKVRGAELIGADVFLVPAAELSQAEAAAGPGLQVIGVDTLEDAISALRRIGPATVAKESA